VQAVGWRFDAVQGKIIYWQALFIAITEGLRASNVLNSCSEINK
jgi:hypothetical protein